MNTDQLRAALAGNIADPATVRSLMAAKQRRRRMALLSVATGVTALAAGTVAAVVASGGTAPVSPVPQAAAPSAVLAETSAAGDLFTAGGCAFDPLSKNFRDARDAGASVITARGELTGKTTGDGGVTRHEMVLTDVHTMLGPDLPGGMTVWVTAWKYDPAASAVETNNGPLWGPGGALFGIFHPAAGAGDDATFRQAPVVDESVILSKSGCWSAAGLDGKPFTGPLTEIPGSNTYRSVTDDPAGFTAVPLSKIERIAASTS